jgi:hypothetical protein
VNQHIRVSLLRDMGRASIMDKWEYTSVPMHERAFFVTAAPVEKSMDQLVATLNEWGEQGWELVQVVSGVGTTETGTYFVIFKRRKA